MKKIIISLMMFVVICLSWSGLAQEGQFDKYGGWKGLKGEKTGWFHTEKINDRWWIITPEGNAFWSVGMYCVRIGGLVDDETGKRPYQEACFKKYGNEKEWARLTRIQLKDWGFNTIGDWSSASIMKDPGFAYVIGIDKSTKAPNVIPQGSYGYFPDVFDERFEEGTREEIKKKLGWYPFAVNDPWLLGYFLSDEPSWYGSKGRRGSLADDFIRLDVDVPGKKAWVKFMKDRYQDEKLLNEAWGTNFKDFAELLLVKKIDENENTSKDKLAFLRVIAEEFSKVLSETLREFDKDHMILGTRPTVSYPEVLEATAKYTDIFSMGAYGLNQGYKIDPEFSQKISEVYKYSNKPLMLGTLISAQDAGLPYGIVRTQRDRGISYWRYLEKVARDPRVVGMHWFQYFDPPRKCYDQRAANWGLVNEKDEAYEEAVSLISQANKMVYSYGLGLSEFKPEFDSIFGLKKGKTPEIQAGPLRKIALPLPNSDFEQGRKGWGLQAWKGRSRASIDSRVKHSGKNSLKIQGGPAEGWDSVGVGIQSNLDLALKPEHQYKLSAWIKVKSVEDWASVRIKVKYKSGEDAYFGTEGLYGTTDWKYVEAEFSPREENAVGYLAAQLVGKGIAWFDDIAIEAIIQE